MFDIDKGICTHIQCFTCLFLLRIQVLGFSVLSFQTGASVEQSVIHPINGWVLRNVPVVALYMITHMFIGVVVASFTLLPTTPVLTFWVIGLTAYYIATSIGSPTQSGVFALQICLPSCQCYYP